jgi:catechol 2,3-dioxygenase-like lactoylglutathione lyase family enzyme
MTKHIEDVLDQYENGAISRRMLITALVALGGTQAKADTPLIRPAGIDHVQLNVSNVDKSVEFYSRLFGQKSQPVNRGAKLELGAGGMYLSLMPAGAKSIGIDHYCLRVDGYEAAAAEKKMAQEGVKIVDPGKGANPLTMITDADGIRVQIASTR